MKTFAQLFKRYRLRSEFVSLSDLADALAFKGLVYDASIFSHWQKGKRVPAHRRVMVALIHVFIENGGIVTLDQANEFLESAGHGYLTNKECQSLFNAPYATSYKQDF